MAKLEDLKKRRVLSAAGESTASTVDPVTSKRTLLNSKHEMLMVGSSSAVNVQAEVQTALRLAEQHVEIRNSSDESFLEAVRMSVVSGLGLSDGYGFLTVEKRECKFVPGWKGLVDLVLRSERGTVWTGVVYKGDHFEYQLGDSPKVTQRRGESDDPADITHFYAIGRIKGSDTPIVEVWTVSKLNAHFQKHNTQGEKHYALQSHNAWEAYGRKMPLLQVLKYMPRSRDLEFALNADAAASPAPASTLPPADARPSAPAADAAPAPAEAPAAPIATPAPKPARKATAKKAPTPAKPAAAKGPVAPRTTRTAPKKPGINLE